MAMENVVRGGRGGLWKAMENVVGMAVEGCG